MDAQPMNSTPPTQMVSIGEALINPPWQGHLVAISDNGGDLAMLSIEHPRHGTIRVLYPRVQAASIRDWLTAALAQPVLQSAMPQPPDPAIDEAQKN